MMNWQRLHEGVLRKLQSINEVHWLSDARLSRQVIVNTTVATLVGLEALPPLIISTCNGLFLLRGGELIQLFKGYFFGFEFHCGRVYVTLERGENPYRHQSYCSLVFSFILDSAHGTASDVRVEQRLLPFGSHDLRKHSDSLYYPSGDNRVYRLPLSKDEVLYSREPECLRFNHPIPHHRGAQHLNSILLEEDYFHLMAHNDYQKTGRDSQIYSLDYSGNVVEVRDLTARCAHDLVRWGEDFLYSNSYGGTYEVNGKVLFELQGDLFARGICPLESGFLLAASAMRERKLRRQTPMLLWYVDEDFRLIESFKFEQLGGIWAGSVQSIGVVES